MATANTLNFDKKWPMKTSDAANGRLIFLDEAAISEENNHILLIQIATFSLYIHKRVLYEFF